MEIATVRAKAREIAKEIYNSEGLEDCSDFDAVEEEGREALNSNEFFNKLTDREAGYFIEEFYQTLDNLAAADGVIGQNYPERYFGEETDAVGDCYSDADPGL